MTRTPNRWSQASHPSDNRLGCSAAKWQLIPKWDQMGLLIPKSEYPNRLLNLFALASNERVKKQSRARRTAKKGYL